MPRGFKRDISATENAYARGWLIDVKKRSFISQPKLIEGENDEPEGHLILFGADKTKARMAIFQREKNRCQNCHLVVVWGSEDYDWASYGTAGKWNHIRSKPWERCDCPGNAQLLCSACHRKVHAARAPRFGPERISA
jgi:hypothetical protein